VTSSEPLSTSKLLLTVDEAAALLGIRRTLTYALIRTGALPSVQVGRLRRIRFSDLDAYAAGLSPQTIDRTSPDHASPKEAAA
jgi:excisionase family DNA binding protein